MAEFCTISINQLSLHLIDKNSRHHSQHKNGMLFTYYAFTNMFFRYSFFLAKTMIAFKRKLKIRLILEKRMSKLVMKLTGVRI